jgi:6-phosphogluconolactonase
MSSSTSGTVAGPAPDRVQREGVESVAEWLAEHILHAARSAIAARGRFALVLAGGRTPIAAYTLLASRRADWDHWHIFYGDERCLPPEDPERNSRAAATAWLERVPLPAENHHPIPAELGAERAAGLYARVIAPALPFDLVLLGMGEDGHTASLFPGHAIPADTLTMPVHDAPKPPPERVSLTPKALTATRALWIVVTGAGKREALAAWDAGQDLPVARVAALTPATLILDRDAAGPGATGG